MDPAIADSLTTVQTQQEHLREIHIQIHTVHDVISKGWGPLGGTPTGLPANWPSLSGGHGAFLKRLDKKQNRQMSFSLRKKILKLQPNHSS